ncbi:hypothetical protein ACFFHF_12015 [Robertmurraya beringensis]|uniref:CHRD domain-containing protein n=1 Tax=Robertmurraya beringensis TaxID=641660 RepID=A0ABV6KRM9_9BACI
MVVQVHFFTTNQGGVGNIVNLRVNAYFKSNAQDISTYEVTGTASGIVSEPPANGARHFSIDVTLTPTAVQALSGDWAYITIDRLAPTDTYDKKISGLLQPL